ncbi:MAG TPA: 2Fe-2S iron-sulfur cluster-binding protein [Burkholderiales bacterium]|jgi:CDP-4-dehydro-6-deoxyglucose reductase/ferredoxin-NAD(P)+ reductase (naphthalene dioxygenase ferredoxin-specific)
MQITLEGEARRIPVEAGDTILAALLRAGVPFPFSCQTGNCGACKCELVSGEVTELDRSEHALGAEERARGVILACRSELLSDATVRLIE